MFDFLKKVFGIHRPSSMYEIPRDLYAGIMEREKKENKKPENKEEWIMVTGYKGVDKNMQAYGGYQFELDEKYEIKPGTEVKKCVSGFHFCLSLDDVFYYYPPTNGRRYFKVNALVRKEDYDSYGKSMGFCFAGAHYDKLAAKSIILTEEVSTEELYAAVREKYYLPKEMDDGYVRKILDEGYAAVMDKYRRDTLRLDGYSKTVVEYILNHCGDDTFDRAHAFASQKDLSMDAKIITILCGRK